MSIEKASIIVYYNIDKGTEKRTYMRRFESFFLSRKLRRGLKNEQRRKNNFREHGIYLLGWRNGDEPDPSKKVENMTDEEIEKFLD